MDDMSPIPQAPLVEAVLAEEQAVQEGLQEESKLAAAVTSPAWGAVEGRFNETIQQLRSPVDANLVAAEYKIESLANHKAATILANLLTEIEHAVEATGGK